MTEKKKVRDVQLPAESNTTLGEKDLYRPSRNEEKFRYRELSQETKGCVKRGKIIVFNGKIFRITLNSFKEAENPRKSIQ